ncbi:YgaP family membrane protein [Herbinix hemicellulosilytica]|uniref:YgaP family membrane protein n=1 Tax=Herbinix hemicellulosilytica TaxID=1564487 RepID=UPI001304922B|nr:DUF2892 domain-containing protein [Herbinix hemicellulosilytica]
MIKARLKNILPPTGQRVFLRTDPLCNMDIRSKTIRNLKIYKNCDIDEITERIRDLNLEWDTERIIEANAAILTVLFSYLGIKTGRSWFNLTAAVGICLLVHSLQGWCPILPFLRKKGIRTENEINNEKIALKILRKDFEKDYTTVEELLGMVEKQ